MFDPAAGDRVDSTLAAEAVWFDAFMTNVDRTARNPNLLWWHKVLYFIDHGASLYFHHDWQQIDERAGSPFPAIRDHVLLPWANQLQQVDAGMRPRLSVPLFRDILEQVPDAWLLPEPEAPTPPEKRRAYVMYLSRRLSEASAFVEEAMRAHARLV